MYDAESPRQGSRSHPGPPGGRALIPHVRFLSLPEATPCETSVTIIPVRRTRSLFISIGTRTPGRFRLQGLRTGVLEP